MLESELNPDCGVCLFGGSMNDYEILKPIGKGKFSVVFRAKRRRDDVLVALKKIAIFDMMDAKAREKTLKEASFVFLVKSRLLFLLFFEFMNGVFRFCTGPSTADPQPPEHYSVSRFIHARKRAYYRFRVG